MQVPPTAHASSSPAPIAYERPGAEPMPGAFRDGARLVVRRGGDVSRYCFCCGRPSEGTPYVRRLWADRDYLHHTGRGGSGSTIVAVIQLLLFLGDLVLAAASFVAEWRASRKRTVTFGLCREHRRRRYRLKSAIWASCLAGFTLIACSTFLGHVHRLWEYASLTSLIVGILLCMTAFAIGFKVPRPALASERSDHLWLTGAGAPLLDAQPRLTAAALPANPAAKPKAVPRPLSSRRWWYSAAAMAGLGVLLFAIDVADSVRRPDGNGSRLTHAVGMTGFLLFLLATVPFLVAVVLTIIRLATGTKQASDVRGWQGRRVRSSGRGR